MQSMRPPNFLPGHDAGSQLNCTASIVLFHTKLLGKVSLGNISPVEYELKFHQKSIEVSQFN